MKTGGPLAPGVKVWNPPLKLFGRDIDESRRDVLTQGQRVSSHCIITYPKWEKNKVRRVMEDGEEL